MPIKLQSIILDQPFHLCHHQPQIAWKKQQEKPAKTKPIKALKILTQLDSPWFFPHNNFINRSNKMGGNSSPKTVLATLLVNSQI